MNTADRELMQTALEAMEHLHRTGDTQLFDMYAAPEIIPALRERLAHCDRCGKKLGGEGDIHTCTPLEQKRFEQWWDAGDDIPNDAPYTPDTPIQFAWAGWQAALAQPKQEGDIHACRPDPIGDAQDRLIAEMAAQPVQEPVQPVAGSDKVICPACCHPFRAIPENVQRLMLDAGFEPPFTTPPAAQRTWTGLTDEEWQDLSDRYGMILFGRFKNEIEDKLKEKNCGN